MSLRLRVISAYLRIAQKRRLKRMKTPEEARARFRKSAAFFFSTPPDARRAEARAAGDGGHDIPLDWISVGRANRRDVILYFHGGAFIMGSRETHRHLAAALARESGARVCVPEYRLAPEHPFPAAVEDAAAVYAHLLDSGYRPDRIAFAGESAGGGLVFAALLEGRARGLPDPACLVAFSPWADMTMRAGSLKRNARRESLLPASRFGEVAAFYLGGADPADPRASPVLAQFDPAPPPTLIQASRSEILEDDASAMMEALRSAGGDVRIEWRRRAPHAWQMYVGRAPEADASLRSAARFIVEKFAAPEDEASPHRGGRPPPAPACAGPARGQDRAPSASRSPP